MLSERQARAELERFARQRNLHSALVMQVIEDISRVYVATAERTVVALDATADSDQAAVEQLREDFLSSVLQLQERYDSQSRAVLTQLHEAIIALPPPRPSLADQLEALDRAILGPPDSALYRFVDSVTLGLFRKK